MLDRLQTRASLLSTLLVAGVLLSAAPATAGTSWFDWWGRVVGFNPRLVGHDLNGSSLNGDVLEADPIQTISLVGVVLDGTELEDVQIVGSRLRGTKANGKKVNGKKFIGAMFQATLEGGGALVLQIDDEYRHPNKAMGDVYLYEVSYLADEGWSALCGVDEEGALVPAMALKGWWDLSVGTTTGGDRVDEPETFTLACQGFVLSKCVEAGYKPWVKAKSCTAEGCTKTTLAEHHQACTRMLRADYCGDGSSYTEDGVMVNYYDGYGLREDVVGWSFEAEWDANGARCVSDVRLPPPGADCLDWLVEPDCGEAEHFGHGSLIFSEFEAAPED